MRALNKISCETILPSIRDRKVDMIYGVCYDNNNQPLLLKTIKLAEKLLLQTEKNKNYTSVGGDAHFNQLVEKKYYHDIFVKNSLIAKTMTTVGGSGALRLILEALKSIMSHANVYYEIPTWIHYQTLIKSLAFRATQLKSIAAFDSTKEYLEQYTRVHSGDIIIFQGPCHNPTGADFLLEHWQELLQKLAEKKCYVILDCAYLGLKKDLLNDLEYINIATKYCTSLIICTSFSKTFTLYNERTGTLTFTGKNNDVINSLYQIAQKIAESQYFMPPHHGAAIIRTILSSEELFSSWQSELTAISDKLQVIKKQLDLSLAGYNLTNNLFSSKYGFYSLINLSENQIGILKNKYNVHLPNYARMNISALNQNNINYFCNALKGVINEQ